MNESDKKEIIAELCSHIKNKFPTNIDKRELNECLILIKLYKLEKLVERIFSSLDMEKLENMSDADINSANISELTYGVQEKLNLSNVTIKDESKYPIIDRVLAKINRSIILYLLNNNKEHREQIITTIKDAVDEILYIEGEDISQTESGSILKNIPERLQKNETSSIEKPYYQFFSQDELQKLYDQLKACKKCAESVQLNDFTQAFNGKKETRIRWQGSNRELIYLMYLIYDGVEFNHESIFDIATKVFLMTNGKEFPDRTLRTAYAQIVSEIKSTNTNGMSNKLLQIKKIAISVGFKSVQKV